MKKFFFIAAMVSAALISCTKNEPAPSMEAQQEITFMTAPLTKATAFDTGKKFISYAYLLTDGKAWNATNASAAKPYIVNKLIQFHPANPGISNAKWAHATDVYYWPKDAGSSLTFFAWTDNTADPAGTGKAVAASNVTNGISFTNYDVTAINDRDIMVAKIAADKKANEGPMAGATWEKGVPTVFYHILSQMRLTIKLSSTYAGVGFNLKSVKILSAKKEGTYTQGIDAALNPTEGTWTEGTNSTEFPLFTGDMTVNQTTAMTVTPAESDYTILLPQTFDAADKATETVQIVYDVTTDYGAVVTETVTKTIDLNTIFGKWEAGKYYTLNITLGLDQILWDPAVEDWTEGSSYDWTI